MAKLIAARKLHKIVAVSREVQDELGRQAKAGAERANALLDARAEHRTGGTRIYATDDGTRVDHHVVMDDERSGVAMTIEYGRNAEQDSDADKGIPSRALWVLHDAFGLEHGE